MCVSCSVAILLPLLWLWASCASLSASLSLSSCSGSTVVFLCTCGPAALPRTERASHAVCFSHLRWSCVEVVHSRFVTAPHVACADAWPALLRASLPLFGELCMTERLCFCSACVFCLLSELFCAFVQRACIYVFLFMRSAASSSCAPCTAVRWRLKRRCAPLLRGRNSISSDGLKTPPRRHAQDRAPAMGQDTALAMGSGRTSGVGLRHSSLAGPWTWLRRRAWDAAQPMRFRWGLTDS